MHKYIHTHYTHTHTHTHKKDTPQGEKVQSGKLHPGAGVRKRKPTSECEGSEVMLHVFHMKPNVSTDKQSNMQCVQDCLHVSLLVLSQTHTDVNSKSNSILTLQPSQKNPVTFSKNKTVQACLPVSIKFSLAWKVATVGLLGTGADFLIPNTQQQRQCENSWGKSSCFQYALHP